MAATPDTPHHYRRIEDVFEEGKWERRAGPTDPPLPLPLAARALGGTALRRGPPLGGGPLRGAPLGAGAARSSRALGRRSLRPARLASCLRASARHQRPPVRSLLTAGALALSAPPAVHEANARIGRFSLDALPPCRPAQLSTQDLLRDFLHQLAGLLVGCVLCDVRLGNDTYELTVFLDDR